ncbi:hypothetical protein IQ238_11585, partial [Pleurocapsales cyanobacterium LEGE 06147]|nr:hypothetical protein [Pleurocapsales cyanobacterium LEGE 06147]
MEEESSIIGNGDDRLLETFSHSGLLNAGESYTKTELVPIPFDLLGNYQLYIQTDTNNRVYEAESEGNNSSVLLPLRVTRETPDLQITAVTAPLTGVSGETLTVNWSVANLGTGKTNSNYWYDEVFLSLDRDLGDSSDISLGKVYHSGSLAPHESYNASRTFHLPQNLKGDYYFIVRTDTGDLVLETPFENNNQAVTSSTTSISLNSVPDLAIEAIDAPEDAISGQTFALNWKVVNRGTEVNSSWRDVFYLSRDRVFERNNDLYLGSRFHYGGLAAGGESSQTASFNLPRGLSGRFYVFGITDSGDSVYEREGENNNIAYDGNSMNVILPPPADLGTGSINVLANPGVSGNYLSFDYTVSSLSANAPVGTWTDAIYLSADDQWDIDDLLLTKVEVSEFSLVDGSYTRRVYAQLPGVVPGNYHLIVRSDIRNEILESDEGNNVTVSAETINLDIPLLEIGTPVSGTLGVGEAVYYRIGVPSGETLQFVLDSLNNNAVNELYMSYEKMPTQADFDFGFEEIAADQDIIVPLSQAGTYYILARGQYVPGGTQDYSLAVKTIDFGITDIETTIGDKGGTVTFAIKGAKFNSNLTAALENDAGEVIEATSIWYEDSTKVYATFDLSNADIDTYNLKVSQPSIKVEFVENEAGEIEPIFSNTTVESVLEDGFEVVAARKDDLLVTVTTPERVGAGQYLTTPERVGAGQYFDIVLSYANNGTHDLEAPLLHLKSNYDIGFVNIQDGDEFVGNSSMTLLGISNEGPAGILRPGEIGTVRLRGRAIGNSGTINITASKVVDDGTSLDYQQFINYLGGDIADPAWSNAVKALESQFGNSWSSFASGLAQLATEKGTLGEYSHSVSELWTDFAVDAWGDAFWSQNSNVSTENNFFNFNSIESENAAINESNFSEIEENSESSLNIVETENNLLKVDNDPFFTQVLEVETTSIEYLIPDYFPQNKLSDTLKDIVKVLGINAIAIFLKQADSNDIYLEGDLYEGQPEGVPASLLITLDDITLPSFADIIDDIVQLDSTEDITIFANDVANSVAINVKSIEGILALLSPYSDAFDILMRRVEQEILKVADDFETGGVAIGAFGWRSPAPTAAGFLRHFIGDEGISEEQPSLSKYKGILENLRNNLSTKPPQWIIDRLARKDEKGKETGIHQAKLDKIKGDDYTPEYLYDSLWDHVHLDDDYSENSINLSSEKIKKFIAEIEESDEYENAKKSLEEQVELAVKRGYFILDNNPKYNISEDKNYSFESEDAPIIEVPRLNYGPSGGNKFQKGIDLLKDFVPDTDPFLAIGNTDIEGYAVVNQINIETKCGVRTYIADIDFWWFDGYNWDLNDRNQSYGEIALIAEAITGLESSVFEYLYLTQQYGYGEPFTVSVEVDHTFSGSVLVDKHDEDCDDEPPTPPTDEPMSFAETGVFISRDPNDILGPQGFGEQQWLSANSPLNYTIRFENDPQLATAPAQIVKITQKLDSDLDFRTFRIGDFGFGDTFIDVPDNRAFYQTRLDLVAEKGIYVDVFAGIDIATGEAFWEFRSIDPTTGEQPSDPLLGFLPPNLTKPEGDGFISYSIRLLDDIATGDVIDAEATIIFDINEPIDTPAIFNTIDAGKPTSTVNALPEVSDSAEFTLSWSGNDDANGSAIANYTIYVAENGGEFTPWLENTTLTQATFIGTPGSSYQFYAVARDNAGNVQDLPTSAQAVTTIAGGNNPPVLINPIGTQVVAEDSSWSLTLSEEIFQDNDEGEILTYTAINADGSELPNWLSFEAETRTFSG